MNSHEVLDSPLGGVEPDIIGEFLYFNPLSYYPNRIYGVNICNRLVISFWAPFGSLWVVAVNSLTISHFKLISLNGVGYLPIGWSKFPLIGYQNSREEIEEVIDWP